MSYEKELLEAEAKLKWLVFKMQVSHGEGV